MQINDAILEEAISETQQSGYDTSHFFTLQTSSNLITIKTNIPVDVIKGEIITQDSSRGEIVESLENTNEFQIKNIVGEFRAGSFNIGNTILPVKLELNFDIDDTSVQSDPNLNIALGDIVTQVISDITTNPEGSVIDISLSENSKTLLTVEPVNKILFKTANSLERKVFFNNQPAKQIRDDSVEYDIEIVKVINSEIIFVTNTGELKTELIKTESSIKMPAPDRPGYQGYLIGTLAPNGEVFGHGIAFPSTPQDGDYFLRTDFLPNRLFKYKNSRWNKVQDLRRADMIGADTANNQKGDFINNSSTSTVAGETFDQRQALSKALRPKADN
jgi:hypothetical protein